MPVRLDELVSAYHWVEASQSGENQAFVNGASGIALLFGCDGPIDPDGPELEELDESWHAVPGPRDLGLGQRLVFGFVAETLPQCEQEVQGFFRRRGAYAKFKDLLDHHAELEAWYAYESSARDTALLEWAAQVGLVVEPR
jgi:hypothetical protein